MSDSDLDPDLKQTALQVAQLSRQVSIDPGHKLRLRQELLRRHQELSVENTQRAAATLWPRLAGLKRLTLVAPPALAAALVVVAMVWGLQISGHQRAPSAEAARLTRALAQTVPNVASWRFTLHQLRGDAASSYACSRPLGPDQRLYIRGDRTYLYSAGRWYQITSNISDPTCPPEWQWAFAVLPSRLAQKHLTILPARTINGHQAVGIQYPLSKTADARIGATAWVDQHSGLVVRLERVVTRQGQVVERDFADYHYTKRAP